MEKIEKKFNPKVSIIIPVYNGERFLAEAIDSALKQTYQNKEIIVVNDGSVDNSELIALSYKDKIKYFFKENGGVSTALNYGIKKATGEYISWLSHDDVYMPEKIKKQIDVFAKLPDNEKEKTVSYSNYILINEKSKIISKVNFRNNHSLKKLNQPLYPLLNGLINGCSLMIPKKLFNQIGFFDEKLKTTQDYDLWFKFFLLCKIVFVEDCLIKYRIHTKQGSRIKRSMEEENGLWIRMNNYLKDEQKILISGSVLGFYKKNEKLTKGAFYKKAELFFRNKINEYKNKGKKDVKVSVIIPFFNRIKWVEESVKSVLLQTHTNLEIILVNDNSSEDFSSLRKIATDEKRIILVDNQRTHGPSGARNTGIDLATGEYVCFLDSDDLFIKNKIEEQLEFMINNAILFSHTSYEVFSDDKKDSLIDVGKVDYEFPRIISGCSIATPTVMIHSDLLKHRRFVEEFLIGEDICFWIDITTEETCFGLNKVLTRVRSHDFKTSDSLLKQVEGISNILKYCLCNISQLLAHDDIKRLSNLMNRTTNNFLDRSFINEEKYYEKASSIMSKFFNLNIKKYIYHLILFIKNRTPLKKRDMIRKYFPRLSNFLYRNFYKNVF